MLPDRLRLLAQRGELKRYRKGHRLIEEGEHGDTIFIILSGRVRVFGTGERDREITYGTYGCGEYIGEISLDGGPRSASVEVLEACECAIVTKQTLLRHIAAYPEFAFDLLRSTIPVRLPQHRTRWVLTPSSRRMRLFWPRRARRAAYPRRRRW